MKLYITKLALMGMASLNALTCFAQDKTTKITERYNANADVNLLVDAQNTDIVFENWNKDEVEVEAVLETDGLSEEQIAQLNNAWSVNVQGNSNTIRITSAGNAGIGVPLNDLSGGSLDKLVSSSMSMLEPMMQNMLAPMLQNLGGGQFPPQYYEKIDQVRFDYDAYRREGEKYLKAYKEKIRSSFGDDYQQVMAQWEEKNTQNLQKAAQESKNSIKNVPASPFGENLNFNPNAYLQDKKAYVAMLNKKMGTKVSVKEVDKWMEELQQWSDNLQANLGENMNQAIQQWAQQMQQMAQTQNGNFSKSVTRDANGNIIGTRMSFSSNGMMPSAVTGNIKRTIVVHMPKEAKLDLNIRHGNIKISEAKNAQINLSHGGFIAKTIDGDRTYLTVAYSPVDVDRWNYGTLQTNYVKSCVINNAQHIQLDSRASNIVINELEESAVIRGSFGALTIPKLGRDFKSINIKLQNSELVLNLPDTAYNFSYNGTRSSLSYPKTLEAKIMRGYDSQMLNGFYKAKDVGGSVLISSKFSDIVVK